jgi:hypothetical protein
MYEKNLYSIGGQIRKVPGLWLGLNSSYELVFLPLLALDFIFDAAES